VLLWIPSIKKKVQNSLTLEAEGRMFFDMSGINNPTIQCINPGDLNLLFHTSYIMETGKGNFLYCVDIANIKYHSNCIICST
jgi:hypothetical protein